MKPELVSSAEFIYDDMESQSDRCLPIIYQEFDPSKRSHWCDRGSILDFRAVCGDGNLLDFGPGDGWPSLVVAPYVKRIIGVDASARRVDVCRNNAARLGIVNSLFQHVPAGTPLPFPDCTFNGVMAASSVEQSPDPEVTLREIHRVLKPGGRLRLVYESLNNYKDGREQEFALWPLSSGRCKLLIYDRRIEDEIVHQYSFDLDISLDEATARLDIVDDTSDPSKLRMELLVKILSAISEPRKCILHHPSGPTYARMLESAGFREVIPTQCGRNIAGLIFDDIPTDERPADIHGVDEILLPKVERAVQLPTFLSDDPDITAVC